MPKVGDRVVIVGNSRGHDWLEKCIGGCLTINCVYESGGVAGAESPWWWPEVDLALLTSTLPIGSTVTFTATGRLSAINDNGHMQVTFPGLPAGSNSFALPADYVALAN